MEQRFTCSKDALRQARNAFWVYAASIPIIIFLFFLPYILKGSFAFGTFSFVYLVIILYLVYGAYRSMRAMLAIKHSYCVINGDRLYGVNTQSLFQKGNSFDIAVSEIQRIDKTTISAVGMRAQNALILHTDSQKIVLLALERTDELLKLIEPHTAE